MQNWTNTIGKIEKSGKERVKRKKREFNKRQEGKIADILNRECYK